MSETKDNTMSGQPQILEGAASLEKHALATVLDFIKKRNLKETEEALKKELGISASTISPVSGQLPLSVTAGIHSVEIDPEKLEKSYSRPCPPLIRRAANASLSVSEDHSEFLCGSDSEEEGPKSWPGKLSSGKSSPVPQIGLYRPLGAPYQLSSFGVGQVPAPITTATATTPSPAVSSFAFKPPLVPTLFTIIPRGLISGAPAIPSALVTSMTGLPSPPTDSNIVPPATSTPVDVPSTPSPVPVEEVGSPTSCLPSTTTLNKASVKGPVTLASIPPEEMTPAYAELKAFAEEFKTKRIQLGYTQGAVGQSLAERGYSNFAQSTISRFEQMQLSASNAAAIKQILERWLHETENPEAASSSTEAVIPPRKRKKRAVFTLQTRTSLEDYFRQETRPSRQLIETIANELDLLPEEVRVWFCNKRQKLKQHTTDDVPAVSHDTGHIGTGSPAAHTMPSSPDLATSFYSKKRSPSPPHSNFSIEELSKSSSPTTTITNSPVRITTQLTFSPPRTFCPVVLPSQRPTISMPASFINPFSSTRA